MLRYLPFILVLAVWIYAFIDCLNTPEKEVRKLPKVAWVIIILLFGQVLLGPVAWFIVGRPRKNAPYGATRPDERRWVAPDDNPEFLKSINEAQTRGPREEPEPKPDEPGKDGVADGDTSTGPGSARPGPPEPRPGAEPQEAELRRREEESRRRDDGTSGGTGGTTPPKG